jgi:Uma2 family endonuclease
MSVVDAVKLYTIHDIDALPLDAAVEIVDGRLLEKPMGFASQWVAGRIFAELQQQIPFEYGYPATEPWVACFGSDRSARRPDVAFVKASRLGGRGMPTGHLTIAPDLVVEVLSPNDKHADMNERLDDYFDAGVPLVWVVDPQTRTVRIERSDGSANTLRGDAEITGESVLPVFRCPITRFFPPVGSAQS